MASKLETYRIRQLYRCWCLEHAPNVSASMKLDGWLHCMEGKPRAHTVVHHSEVLYARIDLGSCVDTAYGFPWNSEVHWMHGACVEFVFAGMQAVLNCLHTTSLKNTLCTYLDVCGGVCLFNMSSSRVPCSTYQLMDEA